MEKKQKAIFLLTELEKMKTKTDGFIRIAKNKIDSYELFNDEKYTTSIEIYKNHMQDLLDRKAIIESIIYDINQQI